MRTSTLVELRAHPGRALATHAGEDQPCVLLAPLHPSSALSLGFALQTAPASAVTFGVKTRPVQCERGP